MFNFYIAVYKLQISLTNAQCKDKYMVKRQYLLIGGTKLCTELKAAAYENHNDVDKHTLRTVDKYWSRILTTSIRHVVGIVFNPYVSH